MNNNEAILKKISNDYFKPIVAIGRFNLKDRIFNGPDLIYHAPVILPSAYEERHQKEIMEKEWNKRYKKQ